MAESSRERNKKYREKLRKTREITGLTNKQIIEQRKLGNLKEVPEQIFLNSEIIPEFHRFEEAFDYFIVRYAERIHYEENLLPNELDSLITDIHENPQNYPELYDSFDRAVAEVQTGIINGGVTEFFRITMRWSDFSEEGQEHLLEILNHYVPGGYTAAWAA